MNCASPGLATSGGGLPLYINLQKKKIIKLKKYIKKKTEGIYKHDYMSLAMLANIF